MKKVISTEKVPVKLWLDEIEDAALQQAKNLANLPFVFKHIAISKRFSKSQANIFNQELPVASKYSG